METVALGLFVAVLILGAAALWWLNPSSPAVRMAPKFAPSNELEALLLTAIEAESTSQELRIVLRSSTLLALESEDASGVPMTLSVTFPPEFARTHGGDSTTSAGLIQFGPHVVCFSSPSVVEGLRADRLLGPLVSQIGQVRQFPAKQVFQSALDREMDVVLNPFFGISRRFSQEELRELVFLD